jgi:hypothetical protein
MTFFFVHVMKTAGTTFVTQLRSQFPGAALYPTRGVDWSDPSDVESYMSIARVVGLPPERRSAIQFYAGHFPYMVCDLIDPDLTTLTMLREPIERTVSHLKHLKREKAQYAPLPLEEIYDEANVFRPYIENHQTKIFSMTPDDGARAILRPITIDEDRYAMAQRNLAAVDVVGLTEKYDDFVADVRNRFGWWPDGVDPRNRFNESSEAWGVTPEFRARIAEENHYDVAFYAYACDLIAQRAAVTGTE